MKKLIRVFINVFYFSKTHKFLLGQACFLNVLMILSQKLQTKSQERGGFGTPVGGHLHHGKVFQFFYA